MEILGFLGLGICVGYFSILLPGLIWTEFLKDIRPATFLETTESTPFVSIILAARNEGETIKQALQSLARLSYPALEIIAVNDRSDDNTGAVMRAMAKEMNNLRIVDVSVLPEYWLGKVHALQSGVQISRGDWLCFTDADVMFEPDTLSRAIHIAQTRKLDHLALIPTLVTKRFLETVFVVTSWFFIMLHAQPWAVKNPRSKRYCGVGAFNLIRRDAYQCIGTHERLRYELLDDMKLGKLVKTHGLRQDCLNAKGFLSVRWQAGGIQSYLRGIEKNAFAGLHFRLSSVLATSACLFLGNILPFILMFTLNGPGYYAAVIAVLLLMSIHIQLGKHSGHSIGWVISHPMGCAFMLWSLWRSTALALLRQSVEWRGQRYPLNELRKRLV